MPFPIVYLLDRNAASETFIRREIDLLQRRNWPVLIRYVTSGSNVLKFALGACPRTGRGRFVRAACRRLLAEGFRSPVTACRILKRLPQAASLAALAAETECRLIHAQFAGLTAELAALASQTLGIPWTCAVHARDVFTVSPRLLGRRLRSAAAVVACSRAAAEAVTAAGYPPQQIAVIHHGLPLNDFAFDSIQPDGVILFVGRLEAKKGVDTLLHACALLRGRGVPFTCVIAGEGPRRKDLTRLSDRLGFAENVVFIGWQSPEETRYHIMDASILVLPSRRLSNGDRDGIANVLLEAMALGTPVLTTTAGAAPEVLTDQVNGLLVPPDDPVALADALAQALTSKSQLLRLAQAGRATIEQHFDGSKTISEIEAFFQRAVTPPSPEPPVPTISA